MINEASEKKLFLCSCVVITYFDYTLYISIFGLSPKDIIKFLYVVL